MEKHRFYRGRTSPVHGRHGRATVRALLWFPRKSIDREHTKSGNKSLGADVFYSCAIKHRARVVEEEESSDRLDISIQMSAV